jgi:hypothetical protein
MKRNRLKKSERAANRHLMMGAFIEFLDVHWPLWRQYETEQRYADLKAAFAAGWKAA